MVSLRTQSDEQVSKDKRKMRVIHHHVYHTADKYRQEQIYLIII